MYAVRKIKQRLQHGNNFNHELQFPKDCEHRPHTTTSLDGDMTYTSSYNASNRSTETSHEGCVVIDLRVWEYIPWNNENNLISEESEMFVSRLLSAVSFPMLFLIGALTNLISLAVFYKQGLKERINLCLFALSLADVLYVLRSMFFTGETSFYLFSTGDRLGPVSRFIVNNNLVGFVGFMWVSEVMSAIIASERCFCILSPLHSQTVLKTRTMAVIIGICFVAIVGPCFLIAAKYRILCVFDPVTGTVTHLLGSSPFYFQHEELIKTLDLIVYGVVIPGACLIIVLVTTIITGVKLKQVVSQRAQMSTSKITPREAALTRMLICNSILFIACTLPVALFRLVPFFLPELNSGRRYHNTFSVSLWVLEIISYINSSFNFFIYYTMGSRYRQVFKQLFCWCKRSSN